MTGPRPNLTAAQWRKSSYSNAQGGSCIEVADGFDVVPVRDSKNLQGPVLVIPAPAWSAFVEAVRR